MQRPIGGAQLIEPLSAQELNADGFIEGQVTEIRGMVGEGMAISALSGLKTVFVENRCMREQERARVVFAVGSWSYPW